MNREGQMETLTRHANGQSFARVQAGWRNLIPPAGLSLFVQLKLARVLAMQEFTAEVSPLTET